MIHVGITPLQLSSVDTGDEGIVIAELLNRLQNFLLLFQSKESGHTTVLLQLIESRTMKKSSWILLVSQQAY